MKINLNIVTVTKNDYQSLKKTINSVEYIANKNPNINFFHYIQDGESKDNTKNYIKKYIYYKNYSNYVLFFNSCKDRGIFDAMNIASKNFKENDLILYLNAGDELSNEINGVLFLNYLSDFLTRKETIGFFRSKNIYKNTSYFMPPINITNTKFFKKWIVSHTPVHQSIIFKVSNQYQLKYSLDFQIQSDSFLIYTILKKYSKPIFYNLELCKFELGGLSGNYLNFNKTSLQLKEQIKIMKLRGQGFEAITLTFVLMIIKFLLHSLFGKHFPFIHAKINRLIKN
jgi:hypothetical protein